LETVITATTDRQREDYNYGHYGPLYVRWETVIPVMNTLYVRWGD